MTLTKKAVGLIEADNELQLRLALGLKVTQRTIQDHAKENKENGLLTLLAAVKIIEDKTKLAQKLICEEA